VDKQAIEERIKILNELLQKNIQERDTAQMRILAIQGALEDCNFWLEVVKPPETPTPLEG